MTHPTEANLALYAGGDLGALTKWRISRHLERCERCRQDVADFVALQSQITGLGELPRIAWSQVAAEMKANIHLGLVAGEIVATAGERALFWGRRRLATAVALVALLIAAVLLERPAPKIAEKPAPGEVVLAATSNAIELKQGDQAMSLMHRGAEDVTFSASAQGALRARYVDSETGNVTINNVYLQ